LFERSPRGVSVTRQGMIYLPFARNAVSAHNIASHNASQIKQNRLGSIRVAGTEVVNSAFLFQAIDRYLDLNPDVDISIFESHAEVLQEGLQRAFDIVIGPKRIVPHEVSCLDVCDVPLYFVSAESTYAGRDMVHWRDIVNKPIIFLDSRAVLHVNSYLRHRF